MPGPRIRWNYQPTDDRWDATRFRPEDKTRIIRKPAEYFCPRCGDYLGPTYKTFVGLMCWEEFLEWAERGGEHCESGL